MHLANNILFGERILKLSVADYPIYKETHPYISLWEWFKIAVKPELINCNLTELQFHQYLAAGRLARFPNFKRLALRAETFLQEAEIIDKCLSALEASELAGTITSEEDQILKFWRAQ